MKRVLSVGEGERERESVCTFDWKNSSNQEASRLPRSRRSEVFARTRARACKYARKCRVSWGEGWCPTSPPRFEACSRRPPPRFSPYGPHRSSRALSPLPRIPPVITPLSRRATKMAALLRSSYRAINKQHFRALSPPSPPFDEE